MNEQTIRYYDENAEAFAAGTQNVNFSKVQDQFLSMLPNAPAPQCSDGMMPPLSNVAVPLLLDYGCGSGRDTKVFLQKHYEVEAVDGSAEMCRIASEFTGVPVRQLLFTDLDEKDKYDGIWACASILHCAYDELHIVFEKMHTALKANGVVYTSFKYGENAEERNGRYFSDFTTETFCAFLKQHPGFTMEKYWISVDVRPGRENEKWLNVLLRKV